MLVVRDQKLSLGDFLTSTREKCDCHQARDDITRVETGRPGHGAEKRAVRQV